MTPLIIRTPASSANLGPGFDCLGLALPLYTTLRVTRQDHTEIVPVGEALRGTPADERNYVYQAMQLVARTVGQPLPPVRLEIESEIPLTRGLGSSAAALVAGLVAGNECLGRPLSSRALLDLAAVEEGHPDNVVPALLGGIVVAVLEQGKAHFVRLEPPEHLGITVLIPELELSTEQARTILPERYSRTEAVHALSHAALLAAALSTGRLELLAPAMQDRLHQPWRAPLVPGLTAILERAVEHGALGAALSGAGPSVLCFHDRRESTEGLHTFLRSVMQAQSFDGQVLDLEIELVGTRCLELEG